jgi:hypothetical protein
MRISEQIARLSIIKAAIRNAIAFKGVEVGENEPFSVYAGRIARIQGSGGSAIPPPVFDPAPGRYQGFATISLSAESGDIYFFAEGTQDPAGAVRYTQPIGIDISRTITAFAYNRDTSEFSRTITGHYNITGYEYDDILATGAMLEEKITITIRPEDMLLRVEDTLTAGSNITEAVDTAVE